MHSRHHRGCASDLGLKCGCQSATLIAYALGSSESANSFKKMLTLAHGDLHMVVLVHLQRRWSLRCRQCLRSTAREVNLKRWQSHEHQTLRSVTLDPRGTSNAWWVLWPNAVCCTNAFDATQWHQQGRKQGVHTCVHQALSSLDGYLLDVLKALVWFWIIDETLVLTSMLSVCRLKEVGTCQVMEQVMIMVMMVMTTRWSSTQLGKEEREKQNPMEIKGKVLLRVLVLVIKIP